MGGGQEAYPSHGMPGNIFWFPFFLGGMMLIFIICASRRCGDYRGLQSMDLLALIQHFCKFTLFFFFLNNVFCVCGICYRRWELNVQTKNILHRSEFNDWHVFQWFWKLSGGTVDIMTFRDTNYFPPTLLWHMMSNYGFKVG